MTTDKQSHVPDDQLPSLGQRFLWADSPEKVDRVIKGLAALCALLFIMDLFVDRHPKVPGEGFFGFYGIVGFVFFTLIVMGAKALRTIIRRDESYYAPVGVDAENYPDEGLDRQQLGGGVAGQGTSAASADSDGSDSPSGNH